MLALLGLAVSQCESGRLTETVRIPRYAPWCCSGSSYIWFDDLDAALVQRMRGAYVTVAPGSSPEEEFPSSEYLIANGMVLELQNNGTQVYEDEAEGELHPRLYISYSNYPEGYPTDLPHPGAVNYSIGSNRNSDLYNTYAHGNGEAVFRIYANECNFPPSTPPPPPVTALCAEGYWPLYTTEAEARTVSPANAAHEHEFYGSVYYMPSAFVGAMHADEGADCPSHATSLPPFSPPEPPAQPPPSTPPRSPPPPPHHTPTGESVLLVGLCVAAIAFLAVFSWYMLRSSQQKQSERIFDRVNTVPVRAL